MSEHLKLARLKIEAACRMKPTDEHAVKLEEMLYCLLLHLESQQETPASETSSAPTTGPVTKRWEWRSVTLGVPTASLEEAQGLFRLTVETTDCSKSMQFTPAELEAISWLFLTLPPTSELHTTSGSTKDGARGVAVPDSPASSPEPAQGGSDEHELRVGFDSILYWLDAIREINAGHEGHYQYPLTNIRRIASYYAAPSRTMKEGSEQG